jgi:hypothetical protein
VRVVRQLGLEAVLEEHVVLLHVRLDSQQSIADEEILVQRLLGRQVALHQFLVEPATSALLTVVYSAQRKIKFPTSPLAIGLHVFLVLKLKKHLAL